MVIDVRGQTIEETHQNILSEAKKLGMEGIRTVCEQCGEEVYVFRDDLIDDHMVQYVLEHELLTTK